MLKFLIFGRASPAQQSSRETRRDIAEMVALFGMLILRDLWSRLCNQRDWFAESSTPSGANALFVVRIILLVHPPPRCTASISRPHRRRRYTMLCEARTAYTMSLSGCCCLSSMVPLFLQSGWRMDAGRDSVVSLLVVLEEHYPDCYICFRHSVCNLSFTIKNGKFNMYTLVLNWPNKVFRNLCEFSYSWCYSPPRL